MDLSKHIAWTLLLVLMAVSAGVLFICLYLDFPFDLALMGTLVAATAVYLATRYPELFLVGAIFAPQWKDVWPIQMVGQVLDLTLATLACLLAGLGMRFLAQLGGLSRVEFKKLFFRQGWQMLAWAAFAAIVTVSYFYTTAPNYGMDKLSRFVWIGGLLLLSPIFILLTEMDFRRFVKLFIGLSVMTALQLVAHLEYGPRDDNVDITRIGAGWVVGMAVILAIFYPLFRTRRAQNLFLLLTVPLLLAGLMASAARGPLVSLVFAVLLGLAIWMYQGRIRMRGMAVLAVFVVAGLAVSYYALQQTDVGKYRAKARELRSLMTEGAASGSAARRLDFYRATAAAIPDNLLLGKGVGSWAKFYYGADRREYPHNLILEILFEEGLLGMAVFAGIFLTAAASTVRLMRATGTRFLSVSLIILYCLAVSMFSGDLDDNRLLWLWLGVHMAIYRSVALHLKQTAQEAWLAKPPKYKRPSRLSVPAYSARSTFPGRALPHRGPS